MSTHTTNYTDTFIETAEDCKAAEGCAPPTKEPPTAAQIEYELLIAHPYRYTSDDVLYAANGQRRGIRRVDFFAKPQPCFRSSALCKRYGWGVHSNSEGKIALYAIGTAEYLRLCRDDSLRHTKALRSGKK